MEQALARHVNVGVDSVWFWFRGIAGVSFSVGVTSVRSVCSLIPPSISSEGGAIYI